MGIEKYQNRFGIRWLLRKFSAHPNGYYNYFNNRKQSYYKAKYKVVSQIKKIYHMRNGTVGSKMIADLLALKGVKISRTTVYKYMKELGLKAIIYCRRPAYVKGHQHKVFGDKLKQSFTAHIPNSIWLTDFTYLYLKNGEKRYNCTILDLYNRSVVATTTSKTMTAEVAKSTLSRALIATGHPTNLLIHGDQGSQFSSKEFTQFREDNQVSQSMSKAGCPYDNAPMERFFSTFKNELIYQYSFADDHILDFAVKEYMFGGITRSVHIPSIMECHQHWFVN